MPSRVRYQIVFLALVIDMISYMDRVCISVAAPAMRTEFGFSPTRMGAVFSIFSLSYFLLQAPWGMLADRYGARGIVATAILLWSGFTALTSMAWNYASLLVTRLLFGASEAALSPSIASAYGRWIPVSERSTAFGAFLSGGRIGGAMAPPVAAWILARHGWRAMFLAFAGLGAAWSVVWWAYYRNHPREHPGVTEAELKVIEAGGRSGQVQEERTSLADQGGS
ncbi:MAG: MFS transporter, partial [Acidobacteria bacterium]|nr:MFS transporter [Acidobacteriota bacterium]